MKLIPFSGMMCAPIDIQKDGDFKIKGKVGNGIVHAPIIRFEYFASSEERDKRYNMIVNLLKETP